MMSGRSAYDKMKEECQSALLFPERLYHSECVNYKGTIPKKYNDGKRYYTEYIAEFVVKHSLIAKINENTNPETNYVRHSCPREYSPMSANFRQEENIAFNLFNHDAGFLDYQYPVFIQSQKDNPDYDKELNGQGKVDLIYQNQDGVYLVELKNDRSEETLLRCILEISTYYQLINKKRFETIFGCPSSSIKKAVMVFENTLPYCELLELRDGKRPQLHQLASDITFFVITADSPAGTHPKDAHYKIIPFSL